MEAIFSTCAKLRGALRPRVMLCGRFMIFLVMSTICTVEMLNSLSPAAGSRAEGHTTGERASQGKLGERAESQ